MTVAGRSIQEQRVARKPPPCLEQLDQAEQAPVQADVVVVEGFVVVGVAPFFVVVVVVVLVVGVVLLGVVVVVVVFLGVVACRLIFTGAVVD